MIELNGQPQKLKPGQAIQLSAKDELKLINYQNWQQKAAQINFIGFVGNPQTNDGEDRGYVITKQQLIKRFSVNGKGKKYKIRAEQDKQTLAQFFVEYEG